MKRAALVLLLACLLASSALACGQTAVAITNRGEVMTSPRIHFVFWGGWWLADGSTQADLIVRSYSRIAPRYFGPLAQYGVGAPQLAGMTTVTAYEPPSYVTQLALAMLLPTIQPRQGVYYVVLLPPGQTSPFRAFHDYLQQEDGSTIPFAWVTYSENAISYMFHELVEGMTDPKGKGVQTTRPMKSPNYWSEIADACEAACAPTSIDGVPVPFYWSQSDGACIAPGSSPKRIVTAR